ncbi:MAG: phosphomannomutase/phosphoglucomutase [Planctomycetes bacterium]|nr:phosphomannomutase/phosphoglucomutase [Planctomycetota bacterium]
MGVFKAYDVRGVYPTELDEKLARRIGLAAVKVLQARSFVVGRDMRSMAPSMAAALIDGLLAAGADVIDIGLSSTPMTYFGIGSLGVEGGVQVTASHNPAEYIGFKFTCKDCVPVSGETGIAAMGRLAQSDVVLPEAATRGTLSSRDVSGAYVDHALKFARGIRPMKVVFDTANGMGGHMLPRLLARLPLDATVIFAELDGTFPNHEADPIKPRNQLALAAAVRERGADLGVAFDGDADRCVFLAADGSAVRSDLVTALFAQDFLQRSPGAAVVYDLRSSRSTRDAILAAGGRPIRDRVGHSFIKATMRKEGAVLGGELSGHYYFRDNFVSDSGEIAMLCMLSILSKQQRGIAELLKPFERYHSTGEINFEVADQDAVIARVRQRYADGQQDELDGVTVQYPDWWFNLRKSNTEPLLRLNLEADTAAACALKLAELEPMLGPRH